jgi:fructose-1-phosphate kinase PfkB-like protein
MAELRSRLFSTPGELEYLIGRKASDAMSQETEVGLLLRGGKARMIAVSLGDEGAILGTSSGFQRSRCQNAARSVRATAFWRGWCWE